MLVWSKITKSEMRVPAPIGLGMIANGVADSLEPGTAPVPVREPQRHYDDGLVPIRLAAGDIIRVKPARAAAIVKNGIAAYVQEIDNNGR